MKKLSDREVVLLAMQGKENAMSELFSRYQKMVYFIALKVCNNDADAQDVVQETFLKVSEHLKDLKEVDAFKSWLYQIVMGSCKHLFRKNYRLNHHLENMVPEENSIESRKEFVPESSMHFNTDKEVLQNCLDELSPQQRLVLTLFYFEQMSIKEIVEVTSIPEGTIKSRLSYARKAMYEKLSAYEEQHDQKVSFHAFDMILITFFAQAFQAFKVPMIIPVKLPIKSSMKNMVKHIMSQPILIGSVSICVVVGASSVIFREDAQVHKNNNISEQASENTSFQSIQLGEDTIVNARDAYFTLILWAYDETELKHKQPIEVTTYQPLYDEVKRYGGTYYDLLVRKGWGEAFEELL